jgi:DNA-binding PadR family transcriptional regulator
MNDPVALLPLRPVLFEILLLLHEQPRHGYGVMKLLRERPAGKWIVGPGTLYRVLRELQSSGLIESDSATPAGHDGSRRRIYRLTPFGREVAAAEARRMETLVSMARAGSLLEGHGGG